MGFLRKSLVSILSVSLAIFIPETQANPFAIAGFTIRLLELIGAYVSEPEKIHAWDFEKATGMCEIHMETEDGHNCKAFVECEGSGKKEYNDWSQCFQGGVQFFTDDRIGDFSISFTGRDGWEGQGLTVPVLKLANLDNWREIPVSKLSQEKFDLVRKCGTHGPWVCEVQGHGSGKRKQWHCGVPKKDASFPKDITWADFFNAEDGECPSNVDEKGRECHSDIWGKCRFDCSRDSLSADFTEEEQSLAKDAFAPQCTGDAIPEKVIFASSGNADVYLCNYGEENPCHMNELDEALRIIGDGCRGNGGGGWLYIEKWDKTYGITNRGTQHCNGNLP